MTIVVGRTTEQDRADDRPGGLQDAARVERAGVADDQDEAEERQRGDDDLGDGDRPDRLADPRAGAP